MKAYLLSAIFSLRRNQQHSPPLEQERGTETEEEAEGKGIPPALGLRRAGIGEGEPSLPREVEVDVRPPGVTGAERASVFRPHVAGAHVGKSSVLFFQREGTEEGGTIERNKAVGIEQPQLCAPAAVPVGREGEPARTTGSPRPEPAGLLVAHQRRGFGIKCAQRSRRALPPRGKSQRSVAEGLHAEVETRQVLFASAVLHEEARRQRERKTAVGARGEPKALGEAYGECLLVGVLLKNKTLPIDPCVHLPAPGVDEQLCAHLRVGTEGEFGIVEGKRKVVVRAAVDLSQHERGGAAEAGRGAEEREEMSPFLPLCALPRGDVVEGVVGIFSRALIDLCVKSSFQAEVGQRLIDQAGLHTKSGERIALADGAVELVVVKERHALDLQTQGAGLSRVESGSSSGRGIGRQGLCVRS